MRATNEAVLMIEPRPRACMRGIAALQQRYTEVRLTSCTRRQASRPVTRIESSSGGEMPALLKAMSRPPWVSTAAANRASTCSGEVTSTWTNSPPTSSAAALPLAGSTSPTTTCAPSEANRRAVASPMPLAPPVTTATRSTSRRTTACSLTTSPVRSRGTLRSSLALLRVASAVAPLLARWRSLRCSLPVGSVARCDARAPVRSRSSLRRQEHVLLVGERVQRVGSQLPAQPGLLEAAERRRVAHRRVAVDRQVARLDPARDPQRGTYVAGPDRPGQAVLTFVRD